MIDQKLLDDLSIAKRAYVDAQVEFDEANHRLHELGRKVEETGARYRAARKAVEQAA